MRIGPIADIRPMILLAEPPRKDRQASKSGLMDCNRRAETVFCYGIRLAGIGLYRKTAFNSWTVPLRLRIVTESVSDGLDTSEFPRLRFGFLFRGLPWASGAVQL